MVMFDCELAFPEYSFMSSEKGLVVVCIVSQKEKCQNQSIDQQSLEDIHEAIYSIKLYSFGCPTLLCGMFELLEFKSCSAKYQFKFL